MAGTSACSTGRYTLSRMSEDRAPFQEHIELLRLFLMHREAIVESIEAVLNAQRKPLSYLQDRPLLSRQFDDCVYARAGATARQTRLRGELEEAHWVRGFRPRQVHHAHNDLIDPAEMMVRAFHCWQQTRWPGHNGRLHYAHTLFNLYILRYLQFLSMRLWDKEPGGAPGRLAEIQGLLDELRKGSPADQPVFVRDARWLIPLAQSLITDELTPYLEIARQVTETLPKKDVLEIQKAHVRMLGGHLTSQIRYYCMKDGLSIDEQSVVLRTRTSNALDFALLVQGLVELLKAYECALQSGDARRRVEMAGAIFQGISVDPELFLNRLELLSAYSMMEHVLIAKDAEDRVVYSSIGLWYVQLLKEYRALIPRLRLALRDDLPRFRPVDGGYSPYGVIFGLPSHLIEHMALKAVQHDAEARFSLEDVFRDADDGGGKLAWVNGWRKLPHITAEIQQMYDYPQQFAEDIYERIARELGREGANNGTGRLYVGDECDAPVIPELPARYFVSSDPAVVAAHKAEPCDKAQLLRDRQEGHFLVSYETSGGWVALRKSALAEVLAEGRDARVVGLPPDAAQVLRLMCRGLIDQPGDAGMNSGMAG